MMERVRLPMGMILVTLLGLWIQSSQLEARPEYALRHRINQCTSCHMSPTGGGPRNLAGKIYGAREFAPYDFSGAKYFSMDARLLYFQTEDGKEGKGGLGVMATNVAVHAPLDKKESIQLVYEQTVSGFGPQARDTYALFSLRDHGSYSWLPNSLQVGRFHIPFGILSDEHKSYVRMQSKTTWNNFETGFLSAADINDSLHYDLGLFNRVRAAGGLSSAGGSDEWGGLVNLRWMPRRLPVLLGTSYNYHTQAAGNPSPWASSIYSIFSMDRLTGNRFSGNFIAEVSLAKHFNPLIPASPSFVGESTYLESVKDAQSRAMLLQMEWNITERLLVLYKYDELILDERYMGDGYTRHGVGAKYVLGANTLLSLRWDQAKATPLAEATSTSWSAKGMAWMQLQMSL